MKASDYNGESMINIISGFTDKYLRGYKDVDRNKPMLLIPHALMHHFMSEIVDSMPATLSVDYSRTVTFMGFRLIESNVDEIEMVVRVKDES